MPTRLAIGADVNPLRHELIYGGGSTGCTDYPTLEMSA
jgi:hypothetical protein